MRHRGLVSLGIVALLVLALEVTCRAGWVPRIVLLPPSEIAASLWGLLASGEYNGAIALTLGNVAVTAVVAILGGFLLGVLVHAIPVLRRGLEPFLASYYAVPTFIFYPVFVVLLGVGSAAIIAIAVMLAIVAMITATLNGLDRIPKVLAKTGRVLRMGRWQNALLIQLPAAAPYLFTGVRLAVAYAFIGVIASEFILSGNGLGYAIAYAYNSFDNRTMYGLMLLIILVVSVVNVVLDVLDRRFQRRMER
ncbi:ABC transporter permease [Roseomonas gilardii]|uniref:ABC transporter permease n=1 Tax=Roseomonas gilardii TaxID=257708 RepID=UPI00119F7296|nr:ABC transporter permease subunit [Roseomonas gilardii]